MKNSADKYLAWIVLIEKYMTYKTAKDIRIILLT